MWDGRGSWVKWMEEALGLSEWKRLLSYVGWKRLLG